MLKYVIWALIGYLSGSVMYSYLIPLWVKKIDVRQNSADHNPGAGNAFKNAGRALGLLSLMFDILKGLLPILFSIQYLDVDNILFALVLCAPVIGHTFPFFGQWIKGGKGIAVSFGCFAGIIGTGAFLPFCVLTVYYTLFSKLIISHSHRVGSILLYAVFAVVMLLLPDPLSIKIGSFIISLIIILKHWNDGTTIMDSIKENPN